MTLRSLPMRSLPFLCSVLGCLSLAQLSRPQMMLMSKHSASSIRALPVAVARLQFPLVNGRTEQGPIHGELHF